MKIIKFNESLIPSSDIDLQSFIEDIISGEVEIRQTIYSDSFEVNPLSIKNAASQIIKELKIFGVDFNLIYSARKYNI